MLIIFDLDDTLIDTTSCITPIKLVDALHRMVEAGLSLPNFEEAAQMIRRLDEASESARQTLIEFLEIHEADNKYLEIGLKEVYENISFDLPIFPVDHALEVLEELKGFHELALVTIGKKAQQLGKMEKAGIDTTVFSKIVVSEEKSKKNHYEKIARELGFSPEDILVCGDRISIDLTPAKQLGFRTVHVRRGRGLNSTGERGDVDYSISELAELRNIIRNG